MPFGIGNFLSKQLNNIQNGKVAEAGMAVAALVAASDGEVEPQELEATYTYITTEPAFAKFDPSDLADKFQTYATKALSGPMGGLAAEGAIRKLSKNEAYQAIGVGVAIANSDGDFEPQEKAVIRRLCGMHGINASEFIPN